MEFLVRFPPIPEEIFMYGTPNVKSATANNVRFSKISVVVVVSLEEQKIPELLEYDSFS
jgi:hypothetical protein